MSRKPKPNPFLTREPMRNANPVTSILRASREGQADQQIPLHLIRPRPGQPRRYFDPEALEDLANSIRKHGVLSPVLLRPVGDAFELVAGERRFKAAAMAGLSQIPAIVRELSDAEAQMVAIAENLQREDLNPFEQTEGLLELLGLQLGLSREEVLALLYRLDNEAKGRATHNVMGSESLVQIEEIFAASSRLTWQSFVTNRLPLLKLPEDVQQVLRLGQLEYTKARVIAQVKEPRSRKALLEKAIAQSWSLRQVRQEVGRIQAKPMPSRTSVFARYQQLGSQLRRAELSDTQQKKIEKLLAEIESLLGRQG